MTDIPDLSKLPFKHIFLYCFLITAILSSGTLIIYIFNYNLFIAMPFGKLVLLSISISLPIFIVTIFFIDSVIEPTEFEDIEELWQALIALGGFYTSLVLYGLIVLSFFFTFKVKTAAIILTCYSVVMLILGTIMNFRKNRKNKITSRS